MATVEQFSRLVAGIYAAPVASQRWQEALREIHRALGGIVGGLLMADGADWSLDNSTLPAGAAHSYAEYYYRLDRVLEAVERGPAGVLRTGSELMPLVRKSEFYEDWLQPLDIDDGLFVRLTSGPRFASLIVGAPRRSESFGTPERVKLLSGLVPHFQQALRTQDKLAALANCAGELAGALEAVRHGVIVVAGQHLVVNLNSAAERIFRAEDGLCVRSGRITATSTRAERELQHAIQNAVIDEHSIARQGRTLTCARPSGKRPYIIHVLPSHRPNADERLRQPVALVLIIDPEDEPELPAALLRRLYHLTEAEVEVALHIMRGADPKHISEQLSVSLTTVRTHLQHVFDKTGTHRQAELVRLLLTLSP
jgi:DNA-binding CsgD family transcriptional regulator/PAS domain-containing protein